MLMLSARRESLRDPGSTMRRAFVHRRGQSTSLEYRRMRMRLLGVRFVFVAIVLSTLGTTAWAQGVQTGTITGTVQSADGLSLPGVTVTAASPSLQGQR